MNRTNLSTRFLLGISSCFIFAAAASARTQASGGASAREASVAEGAVSYQIERLAATPPAVRVTLTVKAADTASGRFMIQSHWGGVEKCEQFVQALTATVDGRPTEIKPLPDAPNVWTLAHPPGANLELRYELRGGDDPLAMMGNHYRPIVRDDLLHLIGETALLVPEWLDVAQARDIRLTLKGFTERGGKTATSFDATPPGEPIRLSLDRFRHGLILAGNIRVHEKLIRGRPLRIAFFGDDWGFKDEEFVELAARIVSTEREFFRDDGDPHYLISVVPTGKPDPRSFSMGGTGLTDCFALFMQRGATLAADSPKRLMVAKLLAHEYFHHWNGQKIGMEGPEQLVYWFSEGFTDYYAARMLLRAGLIDAPQWVAWLNENLAEYWTNAARHATNEAIRGNFWTNRELQNLPYCRGEVVALLLDSEIRKCSGGARGLDQFLFEVLEAARAGEKVSTERLLARVARWTSAEFAAALRRVIEHGEMPAVPGDLFAPALAQETVDRYAFDLGFDLDRSVRDKKISGVREDGPAFRAGLRDGQTAAGYSIYQGDASHEVEITIREDAGARTIRYLPRGEMIRTPQFKLVGDLKL